MKKIIIFLTAILFLVPSAGHAQLKLQPLPDVKSLDINQFVSESRLVIQEFEEDASLNFQIQIPNDYTVKPRENLKNIEKEGRLYGEIFYAFGSVINDTRPYIKIESYELNRMISAKNWIITRALDWGYTLRGIETDDKEGNSFEALYVRLDNLGNTEIVRARGYLNENRLVLVEYVLPVTLWEESRDVQFYTIKSFDFVNDYKITSPEKIINFGYLDNFYFEYPESWVFTKRELNNVNNINVSLKTSDVNNFIMAEIDITVVSSRSLKDRLDQIIYPFNLPELIEDRMADLDNKGYVADPIMEQHTYDLIFKETFQTTEVYPLRKKLSTVYVTEDKNPVSKEFWLTVIKRPEEEGKNYVVSMIAPSRQINLSQWAISVKAYEAMVKSIR